MIIYCFPVYSKFNLVAMKDERVMWYGSACLSATDRQALPYHITHFRSYNKMDKHIYGISTGK
jgi:hypothetical protein